LTDGAVSFVHGCFPIGNIETKAAGVGRKSTRSGINGRLTHEFRLS
jgi:hypothetical protein